MRHLRETRAGRLFLASAALLALVLIAQQILPQPEPVELLRKLLWLSVIVTGVWVLVPVVAQSRRGWFWRVRRKLILSYVLLGVVPVALVIVFVLVSAFVLYNHVASYLFHEGLRDFRTDLAQIADTSAAEIARAPETMVAAIARKQANLSTQYPRLSMAVVARATAASDATRAAVAPDRRVVAAGPWDHGAVPADVPAWVTAAGRFTGLIAVASPGEATADRLVLRSAIPTADGQYVVIADLPLDADITARIEQATQTRMGVIRVGSACGGAPGDESLPRSRLVDVFRQTVSVLECRDWTTGATGSTWATVHAPLARVYNELAEVQGRTGTAMTANVFLVALIVLAGFFLIIQGSALVFGAMLGRSITSAVHELFVGTERIQQGDFTHRIPIGSRDQLGDLADSFNRMSASMVHLLHVQREKQRLDDELRIAREIQTSLLPTELPKIAGLSIADLCEPAREVGGDYYDFFMLGPRRLGVLIADVSGKGTSAALYMAELKGLMLALSHDEPSPRQLLIDVNHRLVDHLDNRSFITMTYVVIDLDARTLRYARAGHTPLIAVAATGPAEVVIPDGMILGVRLPGAVRRFDDLLVEHERAVRPGDVFVLYTDGVTEAMDRQGELFGDAALSRVVEAHRHLDAAGLRERILREVRAFVGDAEPHDDMTLVVMKVDEEGGLHGA